MAFQRTHLEQSEFNSQMAFFMRSAMELLHSDYYAVVWFNGRYAVVRGRDRDDAFDNLENVIRFFLKDLPLYQVEKLLSVKY